MTAHVELLSFRLVDESVIATFCGWNLGVNGVMLWSLQEIKHLELEIGVVKTC
jgi:hypothetical protein